MVMIHYIVNILMASMLLLMMSLSCVGWLSCWTILGYILYGWILMNLSICRGTGVGCWVSLITDTLGRLVVRCLRGDCSLLSFIYSCFSILYIWILLGWLIKIGCLQGWFPLLSLFDCQFLWYRLLLICICVKVCSSLLATLGRLSAFEHLD